MPDAYFGLPPIDIPGIESAISLASVDTASPITITSDAGEQGFTVILRQRGRIVHTLSRKYSSTGIAKEAQELFSIRFFSTLIKLLH